MSKDIKYLKLAMCGAKLFSTCDKRQYMSIAVDNHGYVVGIGYNGAPKGMTHCNDGGCPRLNSNLEHAEGYHNCVAIHAEANCLLHSDYTARCEGGTIYVNGTPCFDCAKLIANSGLKRVVFLHDADYRNWPSVHAFLLSSGVSCIPYTKEELDSIPVI